MMQKVIIIISILLFFGVIALIVRDFTTGSGNTEKNACEYNLDKLKAIDSTLISYKEIRQVNVGLRCLKAIAIDNNSNIYVIGDNLLKCYTKDFELLTSFEIDSSAKCLAISENKIYVGTGNHIEVFDPKGKKLANWMAYNDKSYITSVTANYKYVYAADAGKRLVLKFDHNGNLLQTIGQKDKDKGIEGFIIPSLYFEVVLSPDNELWAVNPGRHRVENYSGEGDLLSSWGTASMQLTGFAGCCNPVQLAILPDGKFVTYEKGLDRIKIYDQAGKFESVVATPNTFGQKHGNHCGYGAVVADLAVNTKGAIFIVDAEMQRIRIFERK